MSRNTRIYDEVAQRISKANQAIGRLQASVRNRHGRSKRRYKDTLKKSLRQLQINAAGWEDLAQDRPAWIRSVKTGAAIYEANRFSAALAKKRHESQQRPGPTPPTLRPCQHAGAVNAPSARESA
ncbi:unnamed protein product [Schistocephalus solidus]|uniref:Reverse transcriptase n=1 Tax=Schistocephalus solidus TaxID=70667 RepID=A0A183TJH5_SCHSO|nr:unnamed protein product [Schistocephalus solidus]